MAKEVDFNKWYWVVLNPFGFVGQKLKNSTGGGASDRVKAWIDSDLANIPLGCSGNELGGCAFNGTSADFERYRQQWVLNCKNANATSVLHSNNKTISECEAVFDQYTQSIQFQQYANNKESLDKVVSSIEENKDTIIIVIVVLVLVIVSVYLLTSN